MSFFYVLQPMTYGDSLNRRTVHSPFKLAVSCLSYIIFTIDNDAGGGIKDGVTAAVAPGAEREAADCAAAAGG